MSRLAAFGDSIAFGLGCREGAYPRLLAARGGHEYVDLTASSRQLADTPRLRERAAGAEVALIAFGITEAMIRPRPPALRLMPRRWRPAGWMDPRPYYSSRRSKRVLQRLESGLRWRLKVLLIRLLGGIRWSEPERFGDDLRQLISFLRENGTETILVVGRFGFDRRFFPGSESSAAEFAAVSARVAGEAGVAYCEGLDVCRRWEDFLDDRFHLAASGHRRVADRLEAALAEAALQGDGGVAVRAPARPGSAR